MKPRRIARNVTLLVVLAAVVGATIWLRASSRMTDVRADAVCTAASAGNTSLALHLLQTGIGPNALGSVGDPDCDCEDNPSPAPALIFAVYSTPNKHEHLDTAEALLQAGADVNARTEYGETALMWADSLGMTRFLLSHGAKVDLQDNEGYTALMHAAYGSDVSIVQDLIAAGADVNKRNHDGETAFILAYTGENGAVLKVLKAAGADINARDNGGKTALGHALEDNDSDSITFLKKMGVKP